MSDTPRERRREQWQAAVKNEGYAANSLTCAALCIEGGYAYLADLNAENARLRAALKAFGAHEHPCDALVSDRPCTCGLHDALASTETDHE